MSGKKWVSVVTATYNMGEYVVLAVRSVLNQTYPHVESIVVDDGSADNTAEVMRQFEADPRVTFIPLGRNQGQAAAKNAGLKAAKGEILGFVDADNLWKPEKLAKQMPLFERSSRIGVVYSDVEYIDGEGNVLPYISRSYHEGKITDRLLLHNFVNFNSALVRRECLEHKGFFDEGIAMGIDWDLWLRISTAYEFAFLNEKTYAYRIWANQMSHKKLKRLECARRILLKFFEQNPGAVSAVVERNAWARLCADYGMVHAGYGQNGPALKSYGQALLRQPLFVPAWKGLVKLLVSNFPKNNTTVRS
ncbi:MAG: glycosyltransferase [Desulfatitalea sp.]